MLTISNYAPLPTNAIPCVGDMIRTPQWCPFFPQNTVTPMSSMHALDDLVRDVERFFFHTFSTDMLCGALTGSRVTGYANTASDLDAVVVLDLPESSTNPAQRYISSVVRDVSVEVLVISIKEFDRILTTIQGKNYWSVPIEDILVMEKIVSARPISSSGRWEQRLSPIRRKTYAEKLASRQRNMAANTFDDICGALEDGCYETAIHGMRAFLRNEVEALLCLLGDTNGRSKWLARRIRSAKHLDAQYKQTIVSYLLMFDLTGPEKYQSWIDSAFAFHRVLQAQILSCYGADPGTWTSGRPNNNIPVRTYLSTLPTYIHQEGGNWYVKRNVRTFTIEADAANVLLAAHCPSDLSAIGQRVKESIPDAGRVRELVKELMHHGFLTFSDRVDSGTTVTASPATSLEPHGTDDIFRTGTTHEKSESRSTITTSIDSTEKMT